ncbi:MAG TPA: class I adenylate-forming enzyme family protein [Jatrophihabitantaceae bacterium]|nr:class I adenylate-forming enzyme family protein [Jatrophihabitantaceae bacterium]
MSAPVDTAPDPAAMMAAVVARLTGPGGEFEIAEQDVLGVRMPVLVNRERSLGELLAQSVSLGDQDYLVTAEGRISYAEHTAMVASLAAALSARGVRAGDRVAVLAANSPEWIIAFWAAASLGAVTASYNAWWTPAEIEYALGHCTPSVLIVDAKRAARLPSSLSIPVLTVEDDLPALMTASPSASLPSVAVDEDDPAVIVYTSGTTGRPKGATHSHRNMIATVGYHRMMNAMSAAFRPDVPPSSGRWLLSMPLFHIASLHNLAVPRLATGETVVMTQGAFDPHRVLSLVVRERVTNWTVVPTMAHRLVELGDVSAYDLSALRAFGLASAPSSHALQTRLRELIPVAREGLVDSYGLTESCTGATVATPPVLAANPGTVGYPIATVSVQIRSATGAVLGDGEEGEIWLRSPYNMLGYWDDAEATAAIFDSERWMRTGDIGTMRNGLLYLTTRRSDLILRGGENVYPVEIEQVLDEHPAVEESAVIGIDHPDLGQEVAAIVVLAPGASAASPDELAAFVAERLAYYKVPTHWRISHDRLPRNATGKVVRSALQA